MDRENHLISRGYYETLDPGLETRIADGAMCLRRAVVPMLVNRMAGRTLCLGWSPSLRFTPPGAEWFVMADFAAGALNRVPDRPNLSKVCAEGLRLPFDRGTFDTVLLPNLIHHLSEDTVQETNINVERTITEAARVMRGDGRMYILEPVMNPLLEIVNRIIYFPARMFLNSRGFPMMCFFSFSSLKETISSSGMVVSNSERAPVDGSLPVSWFLPDWKIPYWFMPVKFQLLTCEKKV